MSGGYVYIVKAQGMDVYKIGIAQVADVRIKTLQAGSPVNLELLRSMWCEDARAVEQALHALFADKRLHYEWFRLELADAVRADQILDSVQTNGQAVALGQVLQDDRADRVHRLYVAGKSKAEVIRSIWGHNIKPGDRAFKSAAKEVDEILRALLRGAI